MLRSLECVVAIYVHALPQVDGSVYFRSGYLTRTHIRTKTRSDSHRHRQKYKPESGVLCSSLDCIRIHSNLQERHENQCKRKGTQKKVNESLLQAPAHARAYIRASTRMCTLRRTNTYRQKERCTLTHHEVHTHKQHKKNTGGMTSVRVETSASLASVRTSPHTPGPTSSSRA